MGGFYEGLTAALTLLVRQLAWLNTAPKPASKAVNAAEMPRRIEGMKAAAIAPPLPPNPAPYLVQWLFEIGPTTPGGFAPAAIGWRDLAAWQEIAGVELLPWEARALRELSREFVAETVRAEKPECPAPWVDPAEAESNREAVGRKIGNAFKALVAAQQTRTKGSRNGRR